MPEEHLSAEKDLLKLIENPSEAQGPVKPAAEIKAAASSVSARSGVGFLQKFFSRSAAGKSQPLDLAALLSDRKFIIKALLVTTVVIFIYFIVTAFAEYSKLTKAKSFVKFDYIIEGKEQSASPSGALSAIPLTPEKEGGFRNIFKPWSQKKEEEKKEGASASLELYKLVGISIEPSDADSYAMIENTKSGTTHFLKKGEKLEGIEIVKILEDKLIVKQNGQESELR